MKEPHTQEVTVKLLSFSLTHTLSVTVTRRSLLGTCGRTLPVQEAQQGAQTVDRGSQQQLVLLRETE